MRVNANKIFVGAPDQLVTGAICYGAVLSTVPETFEDALTAIKNYDACGYVSDEGVTLSPEVSTADINDWSGSVVRKVIEAFSGTLSWSWLEQGLKEWKAALGDDHVDSVAANATHGEQIHVKMGPHLPPNSCFGIRLKDGVRRMLILVPNGQITNITEMTFSAAEAVKVPVELSCYDDGTGDSIHIFTDDGLKLSASTPEQS